MLRKVLKPVAIGAVPAFALGAVALYVDAPTADHGDGMYNHEKTTDVFPEWLHDLGRLPLFGAATFVSKLYLQVLNDTNVRGAEILRKALDERPPKTAVITVANHSATVDDPGVIATILPWKYAWPRNGRWSLCSQEYCYSRSRFLSALFYGAKTLPVKRGAGIDHKMLETIFDKVEAGEWVHIFPEGKIDQFLPLGGREHPRSGEIGRLKWGVGKLIARASQRPIVVPFYHLNMEKVMPQNSKNQLISVIPKTNCKIHVRVGEPISFDDLFEKYEHTRVVGGTPWQTQEHERALFSAITRRIEDALLALHLQVEQDEALYNQKHQAAVV